MITTFLLHIVLCVPVCLVIHEGGHYLVARFFGEKLKFRFGWGRLFGFLPVPRWVWTMPWRFSRGERVAVALSGFGFELAAAVLSFCQTGAPWAVPYALAAGLHLALYAFYAGDANDFKHLAT